MDDGVRSKKSKTLDELEWLVIRRSRNQDLALRIYKFLRTHADRLGAPEGAILAEQGTALVSVVFSLWRAAFLAVEQLTEVGTRLKEAENFLEKLISDNAIGYQQDQQSNKWTCTYYISNAMLRFDSEYHFSGLNPRRKNWPQAPWARWDECHERLTAVVNAWETAVSKLPRPAKG